MIGSHVTTRRSSLLLLLAMIALAADSAVGEDRALSGQIVIDPDHPQWLMRKGGGHVFICGPGDPEGFLYLGQRNADGTRDGNQEDLIRKLIRHGGNCIYMQVVRSHGGDGRPDHNPFVDSDPAKGLDRRILDQWERWFTLMDENKILIYLFLYDDGAKIWNTRGKARDTVLDAERAFIEGIVNRFEHHRNLIWIVAEESEEAYSTQRVHAIAEVIRGADDYGHLVGNHHHSGTTFKSFKPGGPLDHYAMQCNLAGDAAHDGAVEAFHKAQGKYQVIYAENTSARADVDFAWRSAMGGLMPMVIDLDVATTPVDNLNRSRYLQQFFESTDFYTMSPHDELAHAGTRWVLARPGTSYIAYAEKLSGPIGIKNMAAGRYDLLWLDCRTGKTAAEHSRPVTGGDATFAKPADVGDQCAVWISGSSQ